MDEESARKPERRDFFKQTAALVLGSVAGILPAAAGLPVLLDPLRRTTREAGKVRVTSLDALPADGVPRKFTILADRSDAWNKTPRTPIGAIYLRRTSAEKVEALNVVCPHAGCFVDYTPEREGFICPCHNSRFGLDGRIADAKSPSPRGLDTLEVEIREGREVWVKFQNFRAGKAEKIAEA